MNIHDETYKGTRHSDGLSSDRRAVRLKLGAHFLESERLFPWRRDLRDGTQASFREEVDLVIRQIHQGIKDFRCELQQVERLSDSCSRHAEMFGQVCLGSTSAFFEEVLENECLFHRINDRRGRFFVNCSWLGVCGFNGRYEKLALVQSRKVNPEGQTEKVRKSFGPGEPVMTQCENW